MNNLINPVSVAGSILLAYLFMNNNENTEVKEVKEVSEVKEVNETNTSVFTSETSPAILSKEPAQNKSKVTSETSSVLKGGLSTLVSSISKKKYKLKEETPVEETPSDTSKIKFISPLFINI